MSTATRAQAPRDLSPAVRDALAAAVDEGVAPAVGLLVGSGREVLVTEAAGTVDDAGRRAASIDTLYDLSSLTKPLVTVSSILLLAADGLLALDARASEIVPELLADEPERRRGITLRRLLAHCSGLPAHERFWEAVDSGDAGSRRGYRAVVERVARTGLTADPGTEAVYSDLGFILLGEIVERVSGVSLDHFANERLLAPLGVRTVAFRPLADGPRAGAVNVAPCGSCDWRGTTSLRGEVQDENAWAMGGVAGHAGLFGDLAGVHAVVAEWVAAYRDEDGERVLDPSLVRELWTPAKEPPATTWAHGWDTPSPQASTAGSLISRPAFGHLGFTGTSIWIDLDRDVHVILLTNRVHPDRGSTGIRDFRPRIHDLVFGCVGPGGTGAAAGAPVNPRD